jgi:hypothetical protein
LIENRSNGAATNGGGVRTSRLTKDGQSFSSIGSTLIWWLIISGARTRASLKMLRLLLLFSPRRSARGARRETSRRLVVGHHLFEAACPQQIRLWPGVRWGSTACSNRGHSTRAPAIAELQTLSPALEMRNPRSAEYGPSRALAALPLKDQVSG